jgi:hypothetical protein
LLAQCDGGRRAEDDSSARVLQTSIFSANGIVNFDSEIANGALDLGVAEQELDRAQISSPAVDQGRFGATEGMCPELQPIKPHAGHPVAD